MKGYSINPNKDLTLDIDELWIHIETDQNVKTLLGVIYRHLKRNISALNDKLSATLEKIHSNKSKETKNQKINLEKNYLKQTTNNRFTIPPSRKY